MAHVYELHGLLDMCERALLDSVKRRTFGSVDELLAIFLLAARHCNASYIRLLEAAEAELAFNLFEARICSEHWHKVEADAAAFDRLKLITRGDPEWQLLMQDS